MIRRPTPKAAVAALVAASLAGCALGGPPLRLEPPTPAMLARVAALAPHPCDATTASALDAIGVAPADVAQLVIVARTGGSEHTILQGYDSWVTLAGRPGGLVVRQNPNCSFADWYTRGGLTLAPRS